MISAVLDTNTLASGTVTANTPPGQILDAWRAGQFELITSEHIINELERTLQKSYFRKRISTEVIFEFIDLLQNETTIAVITVEITGVATHPEDDLILAIAVSAKTNFLVTGDDKMLRKVGGFYQGVKLVTPRDFLTILKQQI